MLGYADVIKEPMDLSTIKLKIDRRKYRTIADFDADVKLMLNNCFTFNTVESWEYSVRYIVMFICTC